MQQTTLPRPGLLFGLILVQACGASGSGDKTSPGVQDPIAEQLLAGAGRALGEVGRVKSLMAIATVKGPSRSFQSAVYSARDGRARLALGERFLAGVGRTKGWIYHPAAHKVASLDDTSRGVIRGHELHMMMLAPTTRWQQPQSRDSQEWAGEPALAVEFRDNFGAPTTLYLRSSDTLPIGWQLVNHTGQGPPDIRVTLSQWEEIEGVRLFRHAVFAQDSARYVYDYTKIELNAVPDSMFEAPVPIQKP
jgi:hypothetical protein